MACRGRRHGLAVHPGGPLEDEQLRFLGPIQTAIAVTAVLTMLLATVLSYGVARTVTKPLGAITSVMREVAATGGPLAEDPGPAGVLGGRRRAACLASTFNALTDSIARFEKEAAQRERLSSLGRLSSVIAHEIRNPLMIIKSAARTLRQSEAGADAREEAIQDIDQEVVRLNRIVSEVLDYAKPITFTWHDADPNAVCSEAAQAVQAAGAGVPIRAALAPGLRQRSGRSRRAAHRCWSTCSRRRPRRCGRPGPPRKTWPGRRRRRSRSARWPRDAGGVIVASTTKGPC